MPSLPLPAASSASDHSRRGLLALGLALVLAALLGWSFILEEPRLLLLGVPAAAAALGAVLLVARPEAYVAFAVWTWFLAPLARRVVDLLLGAYSPLSPVILTPLLVSGLAVLPLAAAQPWRGAATRRLAAPFALAFVGVLVGLAVGVVRNGPAPAAFDALEWVGPVVFGAYLAVCWQGRPELAGVLIKSVRWGMLALGVYGAVQYAVVPAWDRLWMEGSQMGSIGRPVPYQIRVFGPLNAPGPYAVVLVAGMSLLAPARRVPMAATIAGALGLALSLVRSAWGGWAVGLLVGAAFGRRRASALALLALLGIGGATLWHLAGDAARLALEARVASLSALDEDRSLQTRAAFVSDVVGGIAADPVGRGLGSTGRASKLVTGDVSDFDSGLANVPYVLGWAGGLLFAVGAAWAFGRAWGRMRRTPTPFSVGAAAAALAILSQMLFNNALLGVGGLLFWALCAADAEPETGRGS